MNKCSNIHFFYDKYAGNHTYSNNITSRVTLQILLNSTNFITYENESANTFFKTKFNNDVFCCLNRDIYCLHVYTTNINNKNDSLDDIYIIPSVYTIIGINISKLKKCIQTLKIPNMDILKNLFFYHYNYEKYSKHVSSNIQHLQLNISSLSRLHSVIYIFINQNRKKQLNNMATILHLNNNDSIVQIGDIYYDIGKQTFILNNDENIINYDTLLLNVSCEFTKTNNKTRYECLCRLKENKQTCNKICDIVITLLNLKQNIIFISSNEALSDYLKFFNINLKCKLYIMKTYLQFTQHILKNINVEHMIILSENIFDIFHEKNMTKNYEKNTCILESLNKYIVIICDDIYHKYDVICNFLTNKKIVIHSNNNNYITNNNDTDEYVNKNDVDGIICVYNYLNYSYSICYQKNKTKNFFTENKYFPIEKYINKNPSSIIKCNMMYKKNFYYFFIKMTYDERLIYWLFINKDNHDKFFSIPFFYHTKKFIFDISDDISLNITNTQYKIKIKNILDSSSNITCSKYEFDMIYSIMNNNFTLTCCICLGTIQKYIGITQCHHYFCYDCITIYIHNNNNCPCCRANLKIYNDDKKKHCDILGNNFIYKYEINHQQNLFDKTYIGTKILNIIKYIGDIYKNNTYIILLSSWDDVVERLCNIFNDLFNIKCNLYKKGEKNPFYNQHISYKNRGIKQMIPHESFANEKTNWKKNIIFTTKKISDMDYILKKENNIDNIYIIFLDQYVYRDNKYFINKTIIFDEKYHFINFVVENSFDEYFFKTYL